MSKSILLKVFCLEGLLLDNISILGDEIYLKVRSPRTISICPRCQASTSRVHKRHVRWIKHKKLDQRLIILELQLRYFKCKCCGSVGRENIPGIDSRRTTAHYRQTMIPKVRNRSFRDVALEHGISTSSLMRSTVDLMRESGVPWPNKPFALGIDEHSFAGRDLVITITDLTHHKLLAILEDDQQSSLRRFIKNMPKNVKKLIIGVCIDMRISYAKVVGQELFKVPVVVDKFHVIQFFNWHLDQLRQLYTSCQYPLPKRLLEKNKEDLDYEEKLMLKDIFQRYEPIKELWKLKEAIRSFYRIKNPDQAKQRFIALKEGLLNDDRTRWRGIYGTLDRWQTEILNYFDLRITNAYTEGVHTRIKLLKRISYGFRNKINYIAKMTLAFLPLVTLTEMMKTSPSLT